MAESADRAKYAVFKAKDTRFDGRFFVGVSSTGIYCRPVCRARLPKPENCTYYDTAAAAEQAGFRPCLQCRPERAPGAAPVDASASLARRAARLLEEHCGSEQSLSDIAQQLGCTDRHLRRVFAAEYHVSPVQYLQTCRLLLAKSLLTDTGLAVIEVAMAAGFGSLRRFNDLFKQRYRLAPTSLRKEAGTAVKAGAVNRSGTARASAGYADGITLALGYRPPYPWEQVLDFLARRAIPGVELVQNGEYLRTASFVTGQGNCVQGWVRVGHRPQGNLLSVTVSAVLLPVLLQVLGRVRHLFDLHCDPDAVYEVLESMNSIRPGLCVRGTRLPGCFNAFEMAVRAVLGQQITVAAARTLATRLVGAYGIPLATGIEGLTHVFPSPQRILGLPGSIGDRLGPLGITGARARTILTLAGAFARAEVDCNAGSVAEEQIQALLRIPGIGAWTAHYIAMRGMGWPDAFLDTDYGVKKALEPRTPAQIRTLAEHWRPWRSYATVNLWNAL